MITNSLLLEKWAYIMIIVVCVAILFLIVFYLLAKLIKSIQRQAKRSTANSSSRFVSSLACCFQNLNNRKCVDCSSSKNSEIDFINNNNGECNNNNNDNNNDFLKTNDLNTKKKAVALTKTTNKRSTHRQQLTQSAPINKWNKRNRNNKCEKNKDELEKKIENNNLFFQNFDGKSVSSYPSKDYAARTMPLSFRSHLDSATSDESMLESQTPSPTWPFHANPISQFMSLLKLSFFSNSDQLSQETQRPIPSMQLTRAESPKPTNCDSSTAAAVETFRHTKSSIKRNSMTDGSNNNNSNNNKNNRKSSRASNATTATSHSVKFKTNASSAVNTQKQHKKKMSIASSRDYDTSSYDDSEELEDDFDYKEDSRKQQKTNSRDTLSRLAKKNSLVSGSDYYTASRKNSSNSSCMESSVVDFYRQKRFSTDTTSSSQFTNSINSSTFLNTKPPSHLETGLKVVALEQQTQLVHPSVGGGHYSPLGKKLSVASAVSNPSYAVREKSRKYSVASAVVTGGHFSQQQQQQPVPSIYDKFWVPPEIAKIAKLEKQRSSLPNTNNYGMVLDVNEKVDVGATTKNTMNADANFTEYNNNNNHSSNGENQDFDESKTDLASMSNTKSFDEQKRLSGCHSQPLVINNPSSANGMNSGGSASSPYRHPSISGASGGCGSVGRRRASMFDPIDPAELQKTLYQSAQNSNSTSPCQPCLSEQLSGGNLSLGSMSGSANTTVGTVEFGIQFVAEAQKLDVDILRVFELKTSADTYCKCTLMPDKISYQTKIVKHTSDPVFEEQFEFDQLDSGKLESRYLEISIHDVDKNTSKDECMGLATIKLNYTSIETRKIFLKDFKTAPPRADDDNYVGDLMFSLAYLPTAERLTIVMMKARNLVTIGSPDKKTQPDSYVKVSLMGAKDGKKLKKKKTSTQKATLNPVFNEEVVFTNLKKEQLNEVVIQFTVNHDSMTCKEMLGYFSISAESRGDAGAQWRDMLNSKKSIAWWHKLISVESLAAEADFNQSNNSSFTAAQVRKMSSKNLAKTLNLSNLKIKPLSNILSNSSAVNKQTTLAD